MSRLLDVSTPATRFRLAAVAEAVSWAGLLVGMFLKYVVQLGAGGVPVLGAVHGAVFVVYVLVTLGVSRPLRWSLTTLILALAASVPPFGSVVFERWAAGRGRMAELSSSAAQTP